MLLVYVKTSELNWMFCYNYGAQVEDNIKECPYCGSFLQKESREDEKEKKIEEIRQEFEAMADKEGYPIDSGIKDTVIYLNAMGLSTGQSCEGHFEKGSRAYSLGKN